MIKAIFFDLDNTLIDFMKMKQKCCESAINAMISAGLKIKREEALKILFKLYDQYGIEYQQIFQKLLQKTKGKIDYQIMAHGIVAYRKIKESYLVPYPNVVSTLKKLKKNYKLVIISDAPRMEVWLRLAAMQLDGFFDIVVTAGDVRRTKDKKTPFKTALRILKIKPEEALMVGDRIERDIKPAKSLGIKTCFAKYGSKDKISEADFEINDIKELLKKHETINKR